MSSDFSFQPKKFLRDFIAIFLILSINIYLFMVIMENNYASIKAEEYRKNELRVLSMQEAYIADEFGTLSSDLAFLAKSVVSCLSNNQSLDTLKSEWIDFSDDTMIYDQLHYTDASGKVQLAIEHSPVGSYRSGMTSFSSLNEKRSFQNASILLDGQFYISPIELKLKNGAPIKPTEPLIRLSTPIYINTVFMGTVQLSYYVNYIIHRFQDLSDWSAGEIFLLDGSGGWMSYPANPKLEWSHMLPGSGSNHTTFSKLFSEASKQMGVGGGGNGNSSQLLTKQGLFTYLDIATAEHLKRNMRTAVNYEKYIFAEKDWRIVSLIRAESTAGYYTNPSLMNICRKILLDRYVYFILILVIALIITTLNDLNRRSKLKVRYYALHDGMTKLFNRRAGLETLEKLLQTNSRRKLGLFVIYIDVNGLKEVNDNLGHAYGDELIQTVASSLHASIRSTDFAARMGGDEFLIVLTDTTEEGANVLWSRIQENLARINDSENRPYTVSLSHGLISYEAVKPCTVSELIVAADHKMYEEKNELKKQVKIIRQ